MSSPPEILMSFVMIFRPCIMSFLSDVLTKVYFLISKFSAHNQGKGALLYSNNLVDLKANARGWSSTEKMKSRSKINGVSTIGSLNEQNQGPRTANAKGALMSGGNAAGSLATDGNGNSNSITSLIRTDQYNLPDFPTKYDQAFFFVIKSYSEDDIHKSIKYNVWASTPNGNKRLDSVYQDAQERMVEKGSKCPIFLFFSVCSKVQYDWCFHSALLLILKIGTNASFCLFVWFRLMQVVSSVE
jgi:hypothetical protein